MNITITSVTRTPTKAGDAPATMIILTREQLIERGYTELSEMFSDLPGMDISKSFGDTYMKNYWRGYRNTVGSPYLVLIDGVEFSQLYYNSNELITTFSISNIDRIEIIYGPSSSVYGPNAMMGVVNIITVRDKSESGSAASAKISSSEKTYLFADFNYFFKQNKFRISLSGHFENGNLNQRINPDDFYYTSNALYADRKLWGGYIDNSNFAGKFSSPIHHHSIDFRMYIHNTEVGIQYHKQYSGFGTMYPGDRILSQSLWILPHYNFYVRHRENITEKLNSRTIFRFKADGIDHSSPTIEGFNLTNADSTVQSVGGTAVNPNETIRVLNYSLWQTRNSAFYFFQDFSYDLNSKLSFSTGIKYDYKNLQKAYEINYGDSVFADSVNLRDDGIFPEPPAKTDKVQNRIIWQDKGIYMQMKYDLHKNIILNAGGRIDNNSAYGTYGTLRSALIFHTKYFTSKLLYGNAFQEPPPRIIYGGWKGSGSDPNIKPTRSATYEATACYTRSIHLAHISFYYVQNTNVAVTFTGGAKNIGRQEIAGLDIQLQTKIPVKKIKEWKLWSFYSAILKQQEYKFDNEGNKTGTGIVGDLAGNKIYFGTTAVFTDKLNATLTARFIGERKTVTTNPLKKIESFTTIDININYKNFWVKGIGAGLRVTNLFDTKFFHPGLREANSGDTPGYWQGREWTGSAGYYNSKLPQPGRFFLLSLTLDYSER